ncbi:hypothetical protein HCY66_04605 [Acinetobacter radioresistens]|uniref:type IV pilus assembly protein FimV n=1 Tax=Acinetobacter radioresistens TaxID=40216 RepID=UPI002005F3E1|nr:hypothetical protein [Acinetobacter radioresistens]MCK4089360.1 hypothetical protein [Acinetobacter radioresistens]
MTVYKKLKIAVLAIMTSQTASAIIIEPIQVQSAPGELLYAEMAFSQADTDENMQVSLASPEDLASLGIQHQPPGHLNFFNRRNGQGTGVIVITSSRPLTSSELNIVVKVKEGNATRLQHIKTTLKPSQTVPLRASVNEKPLVPVMVTEKDIALNLPESTAYQVTQQKSRSPLPGKQDRPLLINNSRPPALTAKTGSSAKKTAEPQQRKLAVKPAITSTTSSRAPVEQPHTYVVRNNESLWTIASQVAAQTQQPVTNVMQQIKEANQHAFIQGDVNRLRRGAVLNLNAQPVMTQNKSRPKAVSPSYSPKTKYRLNEAEMSLVAESTKNTAQGNAKRNNDQSMSSADLVLKVMTAREKTVKLQKNVTQLDLALQKKDHKIQLLNARLAQLEQQLKAQQTKK